MVARMSNDVVVIDLECMCWDDPARAGDMEIVEIGLCVLDGLTGEIGHRASIAARPRLIEVSELCAGLTGLTEAGLRAGAPLGEALNRVRKSCPARSAAWAGWGCGDRDRLSAEAAAKGAENPFVGLYIDIGYLYRLHARSPCGVGLPEAVRRLGMEFGGGGRTAGRRRVQRRQGVQGDFGLACLGPHAPSLSRASSM